jgi:hypothetical protein
MASAVVHRRAQLERSLRRLDCLARVSADRRAVERRRHQASAALEVVIRRAERAAAPISAR